MVASSRSASSRAARAGALAQLEPPGDRRGRGVGFLPAGERLGHGLAGGLLGLDRLGQSLGGLLAQMLRAGQPGGRLVGRHPQLEQALAGRCRRAPSGTRAGHRRGSRPSARDGPGRFGGPAPGPGPPRRRAAARRRPGPAVWRPHQVYSVGETGGRGDRCD